MRSSKETGQITVFLSIILLALIILAGVLIDVSRFRCGEAIVKKSVESAARSVLAEYSSKLKESYGIFAYNPGSEESLNSKVIDYLDRNLKNIGTGNGLKLYDFRVENISVSPVFNLSENKVFKAQILEYMKYRAPKELVEGFIERLYSVRDIGKLSVAYEKKVVIDKELGKLDKVQQNLKKSIDGIGDAAIQRFYVNGFNGEGRWLDALNRYIDSCSESNRLKKRLEEICNDISALDGNTDTESKGVPNGDSTEKNQNGNKNAPAMLNKMKKDLQDDILRLNSSIDSAWHEIRHKMTEGYIGPNNSALQLLEKINEIGSKAEASVTDLNTYIGENFKDENSHTGEFMDVLEKDLDNVRGIIKSGSKAGNMVNNIKSNIGILKGLTEKLDTLHSLFGGDTDTGADISVLKGEISDMVGDYKTIVFSYDKPSKEKDMADPRTGQLEKLKDSLLIKLLNDKNYMEAGINQDELPSNKKVASENFNGQDAQYTFSGTFMNDKAEKINACEYGGSLGNIADEADFYDEEGSFQEKALSFAGGIGEILRGDITDLRDNIYINEYIMGMFKNQVRKLGNDTEAVPRFLNGVEWKDRDGFFDSEVEYILHGNASEITNRTLTEAQILLLRFCADTLHVYMDPKKKELSVITAAAIAGWWTGGAGIPILSNLIMCAWGMGEALIDLGILKDGGVVPFYKSKGDWELEIGLPKAKDPKTDTGLGFTYHDYLRLFLLALNEEKKLGRVEDLIQINSGIERQGFRMSGCNTYIRIEAEVSMNCVFTGKAFIPRNIRKEGGRRLIKVLAYEGY